MRKLTSLMGLFLTLAVLAACAPAAPPAPAPTAAPAPVPTVAAAPTLAPAPTVAPAPAPTATPRPTPRPDVIAQVTPSAPSDKPRSGGVLATLNAIDLAHLDPSQQTTALALQPLAPFYSLLVQPEPRDPNKIVPDLAEKWDTSPDGKVYTFHLRKGVKFHDGAPLTAADVVETWLRMVTVRKGLQSPRAALFVNVDKVEAPDDYTVKITLKAPQGSFMLLAAIPWGLIFPKHVLAKEGDMKKVVMGSGPFKFVEYVRGVSITAVRNPDYFIKDRPYLDGINRYIIRDDGAKAAAFRSGQIEFIVALQHTFSPDERARMKRENPLIQIQQAPGSTFHVLHPNFIKKPWSDKRVVQAVNLVLDKQTFVDVAQYGDAVVGGFMFPDGVWGTPPDELRKMPGYRRPNEEDIAAAKKLLADAGYPNGFKFIVDTRTLADYVRRAVLVTDQVKKIGLEAVIDVREDATYYSKRDAGDFDFTVGGVVSPMPDPDQYLAYAYLTDSGSNYGKYSNKTLDELFVQQSRALDPAQRQKVLLQMEKILMDELPVIPNYWRTYITLVGPKVRNFIFTGIYNGHKLEDIWLAN